MKKQLAIVVLLGLMNLVTPSGLWGQQNCSPPPNSAYHFQFDAACGDSMGKLCLNAIDNYSLDSLGIIWPGCCQDSCRTTARVGTMYIVIITTPSGCTFTQPVTTSPFRPPVVLTPLVTQPTCGDSAGIISAAHTGGTGPFTYNLLHGPGSPIGVKDSVFKNLDPGFYKVVVFDAVGCTASANVQLDTTTKPALSLVLKQDASCGNANGFVLVSANDGVPPYTIVWSNGDVGFIADSLPGGLITVIVTDSVGCTDILSVMMGQTVPPPWCDACCRFYDV